ncbi:hypothetical protein PPERSA_04514 [Pseudocohnilembus persalinus]|uniref:Transmembrane protein n=1 Tax=Pseudocohnilembus persalinus TaxID=266149 RepID=A0A0V0QUD3_PSEPJ|nr:hypothetical protein PPERSA_04514 [Pseudocohnilembus persalinus]|eukprot:KRX05477.1 hypothetical protein PPERSA_04514 [Pseudocohnilembus persalinus]
MFEKGPICQSKDSYRSNDLNKQFMTQLTTEPTNIDQQREHYNNIQYKQATINSSGGCPPFRETICDFFFIAFILIFGLIMYSSHKNSDQQGLSPPYIILIVVYLIGTPVRIFSSSARKYLKNAKSREQIVEYGKQMAKLNPTLQYKVSSYHIVRSRSSKGKSSSRRVTTFTKEEQFSYSQVQDKTEDLSGIMQSDGCIRLKSIFVWYKGSPLTENNWEMLKNFMEQQAKCRDTHWEGHETSTIQGLLREQLVFINGIPFYLSLPVLILSYVFFLSIFYNILFYKSTGSCDFNIQKTVYCDQYIGNHLQQLISFQPNTPGVNLIPQQQQIQIQQQDPTQFNQNQNQNFNQNSNQNFNQNPYQQDVNIMMTPYLNQNNNQNYQNQPFSDQNNIGFNQQYQYNEQNQNMVIKQTPTSVQQPENPLFNPMSSNYGLRKIILPKRVIFALGNKENGVKTTEILANTPYALFKSMVYNHLSYMKENYNNTFDFPKDGRGKMEQQKFINEKLPINGGLQIMAWEAICKNGLSVLLRIEGRLTLKNIKISQKIIFQMLMGLMEDSSFNKIWRNSIHQKVPKIFQKRNEQKQQMGNQRSMILILLKG